MTPMRIADGWLTLTRGATLSAAAVATDFFRNDLRDCVIVFLPVFLPARDQAPARCQATVIEAGAESTWRYAPEIGFCLLPDALAITMGWQWLAGRGAGHNRLSVLRRRRIDVFAAWMGCRRPACVVEAPYHNDKIRVA